MDIGIPKELLGDEFRVALTPTGAQALTAAGHRVCVEVGAGIGSGFADAAYASAGAELVNAAAAWACDLVVKVKQPLVAEYPLLANQIVFTYFHLAGADPALTETLLARGTTAIAYETVTDGSGRLLLLAPMSAIAGDMAVVVGNYHLARVNGGKGMMLAWVLGERFGKAVIIGDGVVGRHAAQVAAGMGAQVTVIGLDPQRGRELRQQVSADLRYVLSTPATVAAEVADADLVVGAVLRVGARAPQVVTEAMVRRMQPGSVVVDVSIDQGGCIATSHPTNHGNPVFTRHGVIHYCVTNMPGAYPRLATLALTRATLPYILKLADGGLAAVRADPGFACGVNTHAGAITCLAVADALGRLDRYLEFG